MPPNIDRKRSVQVQVQVPLRRSPRDTNKIQFPETNFFQEFFYQEEEDDDDDDDEEVTIKKRGKISLKRLFRAPNIYEIDNFLTANELDFFRRTVETREREFQESFVDMIGQDGRAESTQVDESHRTSTFLMFQKQENKTVSIIEDRVAVMLGCGSETIEALQLVRYLPGQFFGVHHDMGDYQEETGRVLLPKKNSLAKRRLITIFCYLNDLPEDAGGCTHFPKVGSGDFKVRPKAGRAVVFCNVTQRGLPDRRTVHEGGVVVGEPDTRIKDATKQSAKKKAKFTKSNDGKKSIPTRIKYGLNIWVCEK